MQDYTRAALKSRRLSMSATGPHSNPGPCRGSRWGLFEVMDLVRVCTNASLKAWPLWEITLGPL